MTECSTQPNELSLTVKITINLMAALHNTGYVVSPFINANVAETRKGHPYTMDIAIEEDEIFPDNASSNSNNTSIAIMHKSN